MNHVMQVKKQLLGWFSARQFSRRGQLVRAATRSPRPNYESPREMAGSFVTVFCGYFPMIVATRELARGLIG